MVIALAAIGLKTNLSEMKKSGIKPLLHGLIMALLIGIVSIMAQVLLSIL